MKLLDIFSGFTAISGNIPMHTSFFVVCCLFLLGLIKTEKTKDTDTFMSLIFYWCWTHANYILMSLTRDTIFQNHKEI